MHLGVSNTFTFEDARNMHDGAPLYSHHFVRELVDGGIPLWGSGTQGNQLQLGLDLIVQTLVHDGLVHTLSWDIKNTVIIHAWVVDGRLVHRVYLMPHGRLSLAVFGLASNERNSS